MRDLRKISVLSLALAVTSLGCGAHQALAAMTPGSSRAESVSSNPLSVKTIMLFTDQATVAYSSNLQASGGTPGYSWQVASGTLPPGVTLSHAGVLSGTPTLSGVFQFTLQLEDSSTPVQSRTIIGAFAVTPAPLVIGTTNLPSGVQGAAYSTAMQLTGGKANYTWSLKAGSLPAGLHMASDGVISGTPTASGTSNFTVQLQDSGEPVQVKTASESITIASPLTISSLALSQGQSGTAYQATLQASGGSPAYHWALKSGSLPTGLSLTPAGQITGTPTSASTASFMVEVSDSGSPEQTQTAPGTLTIKPSPLSIAAISLGAAQVGSAYSAALQAVGGSPAYTWSLAGGSLPAGLTLSSGGVISGTPTAATTANFTVRVTDGSAQAETASASLAVKASTLSLTGNSLSNGTKGTSYAATLLASGGTPSYTWSLAGGSLPAGLSLASNGTISGTPTGTGASAFLVRVTDNSSPVQTATEGLSLSIGASTTPSNSTSSTTTANLNNGPGTTWFIRADGGTRYSANNPQGQCDGKADAAYSNDGGVNEHCAFQDYRLLWDDQHSYGVSKWVIAGGDTVILEGGPWRVGFDQGASGNDKWCWGGQGPYACTNPTIPSGTATQPTRILGQNYANCQVGNNPNRAQMTQIFGGFGVGTPLNLTGAQNVQIECIEVTRHSDCITHGSPAYPRSCNTQFPLDDYDSDGIQTDTNTSNVLLQDMWIHGHTDRGIIGPIGGLVTATRVDIDTNGMAGWDMDNGSGTQSPNGQLVMKYSTIEWSGCNQEYPFVDPVPVASCYSQSTGGYGDGIGTPIGPMVSVSIDHSTFRYNTQDGEDFGHVSLAQNLTISNSVSYANNGGQFKWAGFQNVVFTDNVAVANCLRMSAPLAGAPSSYNAHLSDFCRAQDALSFDFNNNATALLANNTIVSYAPTTFDVQCYDSSSCAGTTLTMANNITLAYSNPTTYNMGGQQGGPGGFCGAGCNNSTLPLGTFNRYNNIYYGLRGSCIANQLLLATRGTMNNEVCANPELVNQPSGFVDETTLDNFNVTPSASSPAIFSGTPVTGLSLDFLGNLFHAPPTDGAVEAGSSFSLPAPTKTAF